MQTLAAATSMYLSTLSHKRERWRIDGWKKHNKYLNTRAHIPIIIFTNKGMAEVAGFYENGG